MSLLILFAGVSLTPLFGQTMTITGIVTSSVDEQAPLSGATVQLGGTSTGTITDENGNYTITVPSDARTLVFSFAGMKRVEEEINSRTIINAAMVPEIVGLDEVVITTGYNIKRSPRSTSSLTQFLDGEQVNVARQTNINSALAGKVSGIQLRGQSSIILDRTGSIRLRGDGGFGIGNSLIYVVDGTVQPNSADIIPDDIEDISVLSGPAASAILGSQGANGAIIITTKNGRPVGNRDMEVEVNLGVGTSSVYLLPEYQNKYAGGFGEMEQYIWTDGHPVEWQSLNGKYYYNYASTESWGEKMEGQEYIPWYAWYPGSKYSGTTTSLNPQPDNVRDFYERGWTFNNNIAFSKAGEAYNIRAFIGNNSGNGNLPGSSSSKSNFSIKASYNLGKKLTFAANVNYSITNINGEFNDWINNQSTGFLNSFFQRNLDMNIMRELRGLRTPDGIYASWNHGDPMNYDPDDPKNFYAAIDFFNPYTFFDNILLPSHSDHLFGDISLNYKIIEGLSAKITYRRHQNSSWREEKYSTDLNESQLYITEYWSNPKVKGYYSTHTSYANRENFEGLISFNKTYGDININADAGFDFFQAISKGNGSNTVNGLSVPNLYTIENSVDQPYISSIRTNEKYRALFLRGDVGFRNYLFGEFTLRNDWYSTLPPSNNAVFSKSFGLAWVFSDLLELSFLDYGKLRVSWGEIPTAIPVYTYPGPGYSYSLYKWEGNSITGTPDIVVVNTIHGAVKTQMEVGLDVRFLSNRIQMAATYWDGTEKDIPYPVTIAGYSGYTTKYMNTGEIDKKGLDFSIQVRAVTKQNLSYDINAVFSYLIKNEVVKISDYASEFVVEGVAERDWWSDAPSISQIEGQAWGTLKGKGMKMWEGKPVLNEDGRYADTTKYFGSVLPEFTGGFQNTFKVFKRITITANLDYQIGGKYFSFSDMAGSWSGLLEKTAGTNDLGNPIRDPVDNKDDPDLPYVSGDDATPETGGVHISGVNEDHEPVDYYIDAYAYFNIYTTAKGDIYDPHVFDLTYIKLRELSIGYDIPLEKMINFGNHIQDINISIWALNLWLIYAKNRAFDPSEIPRPGGEWAQFPGNRSFGINIKVRF